MKSAISYDIRDHIIFIRIYHIFFIIMEARFQAFIFSFVIVLMTCVIGWVTALIIEYTINRVGLVNAPIIFTHPDNIRYSRFS